MTSLEEDTISSQTVLSEKQAEISKLEIEIRSLQSRLDESKTIDATTAEFARKVTDLETEVATLKQDIFKKDELAASRTKELETSKKDLKELEMKLGETQSELDVYKTEKAEATASTAASDAELESLQSKVALIEASLNEKRTEADTFSSQVKDLERQLSDLTKEKQEVDELAQSRLKELDGVQDKIAEIKNFEERIYNLEQELKETEAKIPILEMQKEAFEKATRLMEKERDMSLEQRDIADERTKRYIKVLGMEANTKVLLLVDEVGSISFAELGKSLGVPTGLATKHARELEKLGVLSIKGNKAISTVKKLDIKEGEVDVKKEE
jgi:chromosome segregation ATPase